MGDGLVDEGGEVGVRVVAGGGGDRHGGAYDGAGDGADGEVVGAAPGPLGHGASQQLHGLGELVEHCGAQPGDGEDERDPLATTRMIQHYLDVVARVPIFQLAYVPDFARLDELADIVCETVERTTVAASADVSR